MTNHELARDDVSLPICSCGYRPEVLDAGKPIGRAWKAKAAVLNHIDDARWTKTPRRSPDAPFKVSDQLEYPRAGVRRTPEGKWLLTCWDADQTLHPIPEPEFNDRVAAFDYGYLTIGACRQSGTNLNGWAKA